MANSDRPVVLVAGDVCMDVAGIPVPGASGPAPTDNWRLTGEIRTHYLPGGAFLMAELLRACNSMFDVRGPVPCRPKALSCGAPPDEPMTMEQFRDIADRLTRAEIVHSLIQLGEFKASAESKEPDTLRVDEPHGFSGPETGNPSMKILPPAVTGGAPRILVIDDTGNQFRRSPEQWPSVVGAPPAEDPPIVIYKLHRPLPTREGGDPLWNTVMEKHAGRCVVIVSVEDLRECNAPISRGLSWERTALDLVWQLLHVEAFASLRDCRHLIVRFSLDGALYWQCLKGNEGDKVGEGPEFRAWLVYDPVGIEGAGASAVEGQMVGFASAFSAALAGHLAAAGLPAALTSRKEAGKEFADPPGAVEAGIKAGLAASRRLLTLGFGKKGASSPRYPGPELFAAGGKEPFFACQPVPIIPGAGAPDRGFWRLLESLFANKTSLLQRAVAMTATKAKPVGPEDEAADALLRQVPVACFTKALRAVDRCEIENYRALYSLLRDYVGMPSAPRPLSVAVFGPPGAGKSFGVKMVAEALGQLGLPRPIKAITFNLSQYQKPDDLAGAFHLVRDLVLADKIPLVFFDEFDTALDGKPLGWLRYFLAPMQDGEFLDRGTPHPIGQAIFVFAGGTCGTYAEFARPFTCGDFGVQGEAKCCAFQRAKGPDFLSRLRATLDIPGLDLQTPFDPFGKVEEFPCEPAILLRRANIFAYQLAKKAPNLQDAAGTLRVSESVLRVLLYLPRFLHGNRSFEALLDMSHFHDASKFTPALLPAAGHTALHADAGLLSQLLGTEYPFPPKERERIAQAIHNAYVKQRQSQSDYKADDPAVRAWDEQSKDELGRANQQSCREQADHIAVKLRNAGLWFRKVLPGIPADPAAGERLREMLEELAISEHNRWVVEKRRTGWIAAPNTSRESRNDRYRLHNAIFPWEQLPGTLKELDLGPVRNIPSFLEAAGYEIMQAETKRTDTRKDKTNKP